MPTPAQAVDELRLLVGSQEEVDRWKATLEPVPLGLADRAARHHDPHPGIRALEPGQMSLPADDLLLRTFADGAGIDDDQVGALERRRLLAADREEPAGHLLGVAAVHLTAQRPDMEPRHRRDFRSVLDQALVDGRRRDARRRHGRGRDGIEDREASGARSRGRHRRVIVLPLSRPTVGLPVSSYSMDLITLFSDPETWIALLTLTVLEIVLGIDNVIFISILVTRLPASQRDRARQVGLFLAMGMRIALLLTISWIIGLTQPAFTIAGHAFSWRDVILIGGGLFLLWKATTEIHESLEGEEAHHTGSTGTARFGAVIAQIVALDIVFSLDSVLTAVGLVDDLPVMIAAVVIAVVVMLVASGPLSRFVHQHPSVKILALSFLLLIGVTLIADGFGFHIDKAYIYAAMGFSVFVEALNLRRRQKQAAIELRPTFVKEAADG